MALIPITISAVLEEAVGWYETIVAYWSLMKLLWALRKKGQDLLLTARRVKGLVRTGAPIAFMQPRQVVRCLATEDAESAVDALRKLAMQTYSCDFDLQQGLEADLVEQLRGWLKGEKGLKPSRTSTRLKPPPARPPPPGPPPPPPAAAEMGEVRELGWFQARTSSLVSAQL